MGSFVFPIAFYLYSPVTQNSLDFAMMVRHVAHVPSTLQAL